ncbi:hypothetical protein QFZ31_001339 [Neobacillus niacini]|nr:hypothetical protein [Neobacillus niacini]
MENTFVFIITIIVSYVVFNIIAFVLPNPTETDVFMLLIVVLLSLNFVNSNLFFSNS